MQCIKRLKIAHPSSQRASGWGFILIHTFDFVNHGQNVPDDTASQIVSDLSKRLAQEREAAGVSKKALATMAGFDRATARYIEDPDENPTLLNLIRYGLAMKLDVGKLLSECLTPHLAATKPRTGKTK